MNFIPCKSSNRRLFVPFTLLFFLSLTFPPLPETIADSKEQSVAVAGWVAVTASPERPGPEPPWPNPVVNLQDPSRRFPVKIDLDKKQSKLAEVISNLAKLGPVFPVAAYSMSDFSVEGFVREDWPVVFVYELEAESSCVVTISTNNGKLKTTIQLPPTDGKPHEELRQLVKGFGKEPQPGEVAFKALKNGPEPRKPARFFLYGLGVGDKAVGSIVIDQLKFQPSRINAKLKQKASYSFHSKSEFNSGSADFMKVTYDDGVIHHQTAAVRELKDGVARGEVVTKDWDGKNDKGKVSPGPYQFRVRAWRGLKSGGDWVSAFSQEVVSVE